MASTSSREAALERRKALTSGGKKAQGRFTSSPMRVRSSDDARPTRTVAPPAAPTAPTPAPSASSRPAAGRAARANPDLRAEPARPRNGAASPVRNSSRDLALARRHSLSRSGKRGSTSKDRTRTELGRSTTRGTGAASAAASPTPAQGEHRCKCQEAHAASPLPGLSLSAPERSPAQGSSKPRNGARKAQAQHNPSRALVLARREALSKRGKSASAASRSSTASVARTVNPDLTSRELAQKVRELKSRGGSAGTARSAGTRPTGPRRRGPEQPAAVDAHWKVGVSETLSGQVVTGTQANRSVRTTGNEAATCRPITGTEYLGAEVFQTFCQSQPSAPLQPAKVRVSATSHGNRVTGNEVGRSEKVTGDEPGTCKTITGTEYIGADQASAWCGSVNPGVRKVGRSQTVGGQAVSGVLVGRSEKVTGDESGSGLQLTGDQYLGSEPATPGRAATKVSALNTLRGTAITGTHVGRDQRVTGDEPGSCRFITGDEYIGSQQYQGFCGDRPAPEAPKVGFSITNRNMVISGTRTGRSERVTGDEPGTCKVVTGTPYAGLEQAGDFCNAAAVRAQRERTPVRHSNRMTGIKPGLSSLTGAERGACEDVTGTPYVGADQQAALCSAAGSDDADFPQALGAAPWQRFSVQSPARAAQVERERSGAVTGSSYETGGHAITGPFGMAPGKVTGTEQFRFDRSPASRNRPEPVVVASEPQERQASRVTGEGSGLKITGDDWDRGERVTGTEGSSARRRNPTRVGPMTAMPGFQRKRNEQISEPLSKITGSSGSTDQGSLITVSGGARG
ncbi:MAG: CsoS2 family carboxysome shell protein [Synechococcaceae cyanobacterium]|nr:CsoS2 family carboxysome shell protein [Synechococcaceae cyanobacterium]